MIKGLYAAATGLVAMESRQDVIANNIANSATPGFRRQEPVVTGFYGAFLNELGSVSRYNVRTGPGGGVQLTETFSETRNGAVTTTGDPLHVALEGPGFFAVDTALGERFTRNGKFSINVAGELTTADGYPVHSAGGGPLDVSGGTPLIGPAGSVLVNGEYRGRIRVVEFSDPHMLQRQGQNLYFASPEAIGQSAEGVDTKIVPESVELSNVQVPLELSNMMMGMRVYDANRRVVSSIDATLGRVIDQVGMPA